MRQGGLAIALTAGMLLVAAAPAGAAAPVNVDANGNVVTGGLAFDPTDVSVHVGDVVQWTNTDFLVPHTATEDHGLWDLGGTYGATPVNPSGFAPGTTVERDFDAGTFHYYCRVHPVQMRAVIQVPVTLKQGSGKVRAIWGSGALPEGQVFDVQRRKGTGAWKTVKDGTTATHGNFPASEGSRWSFRARVREVSDAANASDWSPPAKIKLG